MKNPYTILGVTEEDSLDVIKKRYRVLAMRNHPDRGGDSTVFSEIKQAYEAIMLEKTKHTSKFTFDSSSDAFFQKMFGNSIGPWR